jgi:hypothetical protein
MATRMVNASRGSESDMPQSAVTRRIRYRTVFGWTNNARAVPSTEPPLSKNRSTVSRIAGSAAANGR